MIIHKTTQYQQGAVSLFSVVFAMLLMTIVTVGFVRIMVADQIEATNNDLSQSAYDSAEAGVEDAKRALVWYVSQCGDDPSSAACSIAKTAISSTTCNEAITEATGLEETDGEIKVQQSTQVDENGESVDEALDQAYTCVLIETDTDDYVSTVSTDDSIIVPLAGTSTFNSVTIEWFSQEDLSVANGTVDLGTMSSKALVKDWPTDRPPVVRAQLMQVGSSFTLSDFDSVADDSDSNANTVFLYPTSNGYTSESFLSRDPRTQTEAASSGSSPLPVKCTTSLTSGGYACSITLSLPTPIGESDRTNATSYLRLTSLYASSHIRVSLSDGAQFNDVQPIVDSTGRANNVFRRVQGRVNLYDTSTFPYPDAALDVSGNLCKDFGVTDTEYYAGSCTP